MVDCFGVNAESNDGRGETTIEGFWCKWRCNGRGEWYNKIGGEYGARVFGEGAKVL